MASMSQLLNRDISLNPGIAMRRAYFNSGTGGSDVDYFDEDDEDERSRLVEEWRFLRDFHEVHEEQDDMLLFERDFTMDEDRTATNAMTHRFGSIAVGSTNDLIPTTTLVAADAKEGEDTCIICFDKAPDCTFVDCNHLNHTGYICCICADRLIKGTGKCPLCRGVVTRYVVVVADDKSDDVPDAWDD